MRLPGDLTPRERALLQQISKLNLDSAPKVTVFVWVIGLLLGAGSVIEGVMFGNVTCLHAGVFTLIMTPVIGIVRSRVLELYVLVRKLASELERLSPHSESANISDVELSDNDEKDGRCRSLAKGF